MSPSSTSSGTNYLFTQEGDRPSPLFVGEPRSKALRLLAGAVSEQRLMAVMQLVQKDPSLAFEMLPMPIGRESAQTRSVEFSLACLRAGLAAGYIFAITRGFAVDTPLQDESTTLLQAACELQATRDCSADVSNLLAMGASPSIIPHHVMYAVVHAAFPSGSTQHAPGPLAMLLDAKANFAYSAEYMCPYSVLVNTKGWDDAETAAALTKMAARFVKGGLDLDRKTGGPPQTPLMRAVGSKNGPAAIALIRVGAKCSPEVLNGKDLFALMSANGLEEFKPAAQAALMDAHISMKTRELTAAQSADQQAARPTRSRRLGAGV